MMLERITGPACPRCGFEGSTLITTTERVGYRDDRIVSRETIERRECDECGLRYHTRGTPPPEVVTVQPIRCPACDSPQTHVTSSRLPLRYHRCDGCGRNFKSLETS